MPSPHPPRRQLSPRRRRLFIWLALLLALTPLLGLEMYVRATRPHLDLWALTGRSIGPSVLREWAFVDAFSAYRPKPGLLAGDKTVNSHGMISTPELAVAKPAGVLRVLFLGGSATAGTGQNLPDALTWPWQTVELLRQRFPDRQIELINGAVSGYSSFESYGRLWSRLRFFAPDIIVLNQGWNEMYYFDDVDRALTWRTLPNGDWTFERVAEPYIVYQPLAVDWLIRPSQFLSYARVALSPRVAGEVGAERPLTSGYDAQALTVWRDHLRLFQQTAAVLDAELFVVKQPTLIVPDLPAELRARVRYEFHGFDHDTHVQAYADLYRVIDEEIPAGRVIDLTHLSGAPDLFFDHVHPTPAGAAAIAADVAAVLGGYLGAGR